MELDAALAHRYGRWRDARLGDVPVNFLADADTTGGNSGSPVVNGRGELVGVNFDRVWENVANDFGYNPDVARNVNVDVRYLLWMLDVVQHASGVLRELGVGTFPAAPVAGTATPRTHVTPASAPAGGQASRLPGGQAAGRRLSGRRDGGVTASSLCARGGRSALGIRRARAPRGTGSRDTADTRSAAARPCSKRARSWAAARATASRSRSAAAGRARRGGCAGEARARGSRSAPRCGSACGRRRRSRRCAGRPSPRAG